MGACIEHKQYKKGSCADCGICRYCRPPEECNNKRNHFNWIREARRSGQVEDQNPQGMVTPSNRKITHRRGKRSSSLRGKKRTRMNEDDDDEMEPINRELSSTTYNSSNKSQLTAICEILKINPNILECPVNGFDPDSLNNTSSRAFERAQRIVRTMTKQICDLVSPSNPSFKSAMMDKNMTLEASTQKFTKNVSDLIFLGNRNTRIIVQSVLASSFERKFIQTFLSKESDRYIGTENEVRAKAKCLMGKVQFASLRKVFEVLKRGRGVPKHNYTYRIDSTKLSTAITFLQGSLCVKPGVTRDVRIAGNTFKNMPVYERGGKSIESMNEAYNNSFAEGERVGRDTFVDLTKLLTKKGESKAGLSTYYINLRYSASIFTQMMKRVSCFPYADSDEQRAVKKEADTLIEEWKKIQMFLMWEYSNRHLKIEDCDRAHCCTYALGGTCTHEHQDVSCDKCSGCFTFFQTKVQEFLTRVEEAEFTETSHTEELQSMFDALPKLTYAVAYYMAHRLRARVQFHAIRNIKQKLRNDPSKVLIVMDHKQKILQMKYREGQVEYYGKKGMSMLGTMIVQWSSEKKGFVYCFENYAFKGYAGQDNVQVAAAIQQTVKEVKTNYPEIREIIFQSDNATCFASQELIPFIYHLNAKSRTTGAPIISKWIFTEAQTGRGRLDTHFSYINLVLKAFVEDGNDVVLEDHILEALSFRGGIAGTAVLLYNCSNLPSKTLEKKYKSAKVSSRATHEIIWYEDKVCIYESSEITAPEVVKKAKLDKHQPCHIEANVERIFRSTKPPLVVPENQENEENEQTETNEIITSKGTAIDSALLQTGIVRTQPQPTELSLISESCTPTPDGVSYKWAGYPGNNPNKLSLPCLLKLKELYDIGKVNKKQKVGAERAHQILLDTVVVDRWDQKLIVTVPKIKAFFQLTPKKMEDTLASHEIEDADVNDAAIGLVEAERELSAMEMLDANDEDFMDFQTTN